jgi:PST family polysaccharide transporter
LQGRFVLPSKHGIDRYFAENKPYSGLGRDTLRSGVAFVGVRGLNIFVQLASTIVLARLLTPRDFGLVALVLALVGYAPMLIDFGTGEACTQKARITETQISTLFWLNVAIGLALTIILVGTSGLIARFFGEPALADIALVSSVTFLMLAVSIQHHALMRRVMQFQRIAFIDLATNMIGSAASVVMAFAGFGYWALVAKPIVTSGLSTLGVWASCRWVPGRPRLSADVKDLVGFGFGVTGFTLTDYIARSADRVAIGYFQGPGALGYFQNAYTFYNNLLSVLTDPSHNIVTSGLCKLRNDVDDLRRSWATALSSLIFFAAPAFAVLATTGQDLVVIILGEKWAPAGPLLCIFAVRGIADSIERTLGWLHVAAGRADRWMRWGCFSAVCQLAALALGLPFGVVGVAMAYAIVMFGLAVPALVYAGRPVGIKTGDVLQAVGPQTVAALVALTVALMVQHVYFGDASPIVRMVISVPICLGAYIAIAVGVFRITRPLHVALYLLRDLSPKRLPGNP